MRSILDLSGTWAFSLEADAVPEKIPPNWLRVEVPHTWNNADGTDGGNDYYRGKGYYARMVRREDLGEADIWYLQLDGTNASADVYVNGMHMGHHDGGYSRWNVDITAALTEPENLLCVVVDNSKNDCVYPQQADFTFYGGIYRKVRLVGVKKSHFCMDYYGGNGLWVTPLPKEEKITAREDGTLREDEVHVSVKAWITGAREGQWIRVGIFDKEGETVFESTERIFGRKEDEASKKEEKEGGDIPGSARKVKGDLIVNNAHLWNGKKDPYLYTVRAVLIGDDGKELDEVSVRTGIRVFRIDPDQGFILNGVRTPLHGAARHQDRAGKGNALSFDDQKEDMDIMCGMGINTIRLAHYQHSQDFYDLCDARGMVVWAEIPYISKHMPKGRENTISQMKELIAQNAHHPCIAVWGLSNEITMGSVDEDLMENHRILNDLVHRMDPERKTVMAFLGACSFREPITYLPDVMSYNLYRGWYDGTVEETGPMLDEIHSAHPDQPLGLSEYGADALDWHTKNPRKGDYTEEYQALYHEKAIAQIMTRPYLWATHVWNMFDFGADGREEGGGKGQNRKGLVTFDRKYKKDAYYAYKAWLSDEPFVHICGKRRIDREEGKTEIKVYSNQPSVELFVNGKRVGVDDKEKYFFHFVVPNKGTSKIEAVAGNLRDTAVIRKVKEPAYVMKDSGIILNWFDLEEKEGYFSLNDKIEDIQKSPEAFGVLTDLLPFMRHPDPKMAGFFCTMTALRMINFAAAGTFGEKMALTKEDVLLANKKLNAIQKTA